MTVLRRFPQRLTFPLLALLACTSEPRVLDAPTQIMLRIGASEDVRQDSSALRITLARALPTADGEEVKWATSSTSIPRSKLKWPVDMPVTPKSKSDSFSTFEVVAELVNDDEVLAQARAVTTLEPGQRRVLPLFIELCRGHEPNFVCAEVDCHGPQCTVCRDDGSCRPVGRTDITDLATIEDAAQGGAARDAASMPDGVRDAGRDAGQRDSAVQTSEPDAELGPDDGSMSLPMCDKEGALRCGTSGTGVRERCEGGAWVEHAACEAGFVCDGESGEAASCIKLAELCIGNADQTVCERDQMHFCNAQGEISTGEKCKSERHCAQGRSSGKCAECLPGEYRCMGAALEVCSSDGTSFEPSKMCTSASLCNETAGACTSAPCSANSAICMGDELRTCKADQSGFNAGVSCMPGLCDAVGKQCDTCQPGSTTCGGNNVLTCSADGQTLAMQACAAPRSLCTGDGVCVECTASSPCAQSADACKAASCDLARGTCAVTNKPAGTRCTTGRCSNAGRCVRCLEASHCPEPAAECVAATCSATNSCGTAPKRAGTPCSSGRVCDGAGACVACVSDAQCTSGSARRCSENRCVQCSSEAHCAANESCTRNVCRPKCGNGELDPGEECEQGVDGWTTQTCSSTSCERTAYRPCSSNAQCQFTEECLHGVCASTCLGSTSTDPQGMCKSIPTHTRSCYLEYCLVRCSSSGGCPSELVCQNDPALGLFDGHCLGMRLVP